MAYSVAYSAVCDHLFKTINYLKFSIPIRYCRTRNPKAARVAPVPSMTRGHCRVRGDVSALERRWRPISFDGPHRLDYADKCAANIIKHESLLSVRSRSLPFHC